MENEKPACGVCGHQISTKPIKAWLGTPPPGWKPGDPVPHVCPPSEFWKKEAKRPSMDGGPIGPPTGPNPELYAELAKPFLSEAEGDAALKAFLVDVHAARVKNRIANVLVMPAIVVDGVGAQAQLAFYGDQQLATLFAATALRQFKAIDDRRIAEIAGYLRETCGDALVKEEDDG